MYGKEITNGGLVGLLAGGWWSDLGEENCFRRRELWQEHQTGSWGSHQGDLGLSRKGTIGVKQWDQSWKTMGTGELGEDLKTVFAVTQKSSFRKHPLLLGRSCRVLIFLCPILYGPCPPQVLPASLSLGSIHWRGRGQTRRWLWWGLPWDSWADGDEMTIIRSMWRRGQVICARSVNRLMTTLCVLIVLKAPSQNSFYLITPTASSHFIKMSTLRTCSNNFQKCH